MNNKAANVDNLPALLKYSILENITFRNKSVVMTWKLYFSYDKGDYTQSYNLSLLNCSDFTLTSKTKTLSEAEVSSYPDLQLLLLAYNLVADHPDHDVFFCRIIQPSVFDYAIVSLIIHFQDFIIRDDAGQEVSTAQVTDLFSRYNQLLLQNPATSVLKNQYNAFLKKDLKELLKKRGFKGKSSFFYFSSGYITFAIEVVKGRWNSALSYSFILRLHLFGGRYAPSINISKLEELISHDSVLLFTRNVGPLENANEGLGYTFNGRIPLLLLRNIVVTDMEREIFPLIEKLQTKESVLAYLTDINQHSPNQPLTSSLAILQGLWGNREASQKIFKASGMDSEKVKAIQTYYKLT